MISRAEGGKDSATNYGQSNAGTAAFLVLALLLSVLAGAAVGLPNYLPTNDGPEHVFASHVAPRLDDPSLGYGRYLQLGATFSQVGFDHLLAFFELLLPWREALRACLVAMVLLWAWGVVALAAAVGGKRRMWLGLFGFAAAVQWVLYMGFFPFYLSSGFGFYVLALAFMRSAWNRTWRLVLAAGLACQVLLHPVPALSSMIVLAAIVIARTKPREHLREAWQWGLMVLPALVLVSVSLGPSGGHSGWWIMPMAERALLAMRAFVSGPWWRWAPFPACALAGAGFCVVRKQWREDNRQGALLMAGSIFALLATQAPYHIPGWNFFHMRFSPLAAVLLTLLLPIERWPRWARQGGLVLLVSFAVGSNAWALAYNLKLCRASSDLLSGLDRPLRRDGVRLPLIIEPRAGEPQDFLQRVVPGCLANWNVGALYAVEQGGVPAFGFAESETLHALVWRWPVGQGLRPPRPARGFEHSLSEPEVLGLPGGRKAAVTYLLSFAPHYQDVIFYGRPEEVAWLHERHFLVDYEQGGLAIARFQACPTELVLAPGPSGHLATRVDLGWLPAKQTIHTLNLPAVAGAQTSRVLPIPSPCGEIWLRVVFDGEPDAATGHTTCMESDANGVFAVHVEPGTSSIPCHPGRPLHRPAAENGSPDRPRAPSGL
jgi:hypothetical protein